MSSRQVATVVASALVLLCIPGIAAVVAAASAAPFVKIGFGSCNKHGNPQQYWRVIARELQAPLLAAAPVSGDPHDAASIADRAAAAGRQQLPARSTAACDSASDAGCIDGWIWLGDVIYADTNPFPGVWLPSTVDNMARKFSEMRHAPEYDAFVRRVRPVGADAAKSDAAQRHLIGVWDDHDMGKNDGGKEYGDVVATRGLFLDFHDVPAGDARRRRDGVHSYHAFPFPADGRGDAAAVRRLRGRYEHAVCAVLLDGRTHRDAIGNETGDMLGDEQWAWLERLLATGAEDAAGAGKPLTDRCLLTVIGSGVQVLSDEKPCEQWGHFPESRRRLMELLHTTRSERFVFLSGDVHLGEIMQLDVAPPAAGCDRDASAEQCVNASPLAIPVVDVTASGLTHSVGFVIPLSLFDFLFPTQRRSARFLREQFGSIAITADGSGDTATAVFTLHDVVSGATVVQLRLGLHTELSLPAAVRRGAAAGACRTPGCAVAPTPSWLRSLLFFLRRTLSPRLQIHVMIYLAIWGFISGGCCCCVACLLLLRRWWRCRKAKQE
jgi:alkaline phosphatase D